MSFSDSELTATHVARVRGWVTREIKNAEKSLQEVPGFSVDYYQRLSSTILHRFDKYDALYEAYVTHEKDSQLSKKEDEERDKKDQEVNDILLKLQRKIDQLKASTTPANPVQPTAPVVTKPKFPTIEVPEFSGKFEEWSEFWDVFDSLVHSNQSIDVVLKFTLLRNALTGKAKESIRGFKTTDADYDEAVRFLKDTYADKKKVKRVLIRKLLDTRKPSLSYNSLLTFQQDVVSTLRSLKAFEDVEGSEWIFSELVQRLLPPEAEKFIIQRYHTEYLTFKNLIKGLGEFISWIEQSKEFVKKSDGHPREMEKDRKSSEHLGRKDLGHYSAAFVKKTQKNECVFCGMSNHVSSNCKKFPTIQGRKDKLKDLNRCLKCTLYGHFVKDCAVKLTCNLCKKTGHRDVFCYANFSDANFKADKSGKNIQSSGLVMLSSQRYKTVKPTIPSCALPTATATLYNDAGQAAEGRVFFDQGSQCSFITKNLANTLGLTIQEELTLGIKAFRSELKEQLYGVAEAVVQIGTRRAQVKFLIIDDLPLTIYTPGISKAAQELSGAGFKLADKNLGSDVLDDISIIIGAAYFGKFLGRFKYWNGYSMMMAPGGLILLYGEIPNAPSPQINGVHHAVVMRIAVSISPMERVDWIDENINEVNKLWELEGIGIKTQNEMAYEDMEAKSEYLKSVKYDGNQYWVRLPWKSIHPPLPDNYKRARAQLASLLSTLSKDKMKMENYDKIIKQQIQSGFIEPVVEDNPYVARCHYLPHHGVVKDSATTPLRVVFNGSSKSHGTVSLNDCLITGPSLSEKLNNILLKFRSEKYAYAADISKAFLRVGLQEQDRDFTRFVWVRDINEEPHHIVTYRFKAVLFGTTSSPFLLQATIEKHLGDSSSPLADKILSSFYVDNFQGTTSNEEELIDIFNEANLELARANMPLQCWNSNNAKLQRLIGDFFPEEARPEQISILGMNWNVRGDFMELKQASFPPYKALTKRKLLSLVSSVFDPLGLISPLLIRGKILIQEAWKQKMDWDDPLSGYFNQEWEKLKLDLEQVSQFKFPRSVGSNCEDCHLSVFCDASTKAYGAAAYIVSEDSNLLMSKARVAPLSARTLPQLELTAMYIGAQLIRYISTQYPVKMKSVKLYSDSEVALKWAQNNNSNIVYVKNRVSEIRRVCADYKVELKHIASKDNPADLLSRGCKVKDLLKDDIWFKGPGKVECAKNVNLIVSNEILRSPNTSEPFYDIERVSSLRKLLKVTSFIFNFLRKLRPMIKLPNDEISYWIKCEQTKYYGDIFQFLTRKTRSSSTYEAKNLVQQLGLFLTGDGILRSRGRIENSALKETGKFPILLPPKSYLTTLIVRREHETMSHVGVAATLCSLRMNYWIPRGRQIVRKIVTDCMVCKKVSGKEYTYPGPPPLPQERVCFDAPFTTVGVDYTGAISLSKTNDSGKYYICLFTCASSRAIHLELAGDLSAETFLLLFRKFVARRSLPRKLISDNATNFNASAKFLKDLSQEPSVKEFLEDKKIEWQFIAPRAPWQGGFYEKLIGVVKSCLRKSLFKKRLGRDELEAILCETEAIVNNRPLTYLHVENEGDEVLTPSLLLHGRNMELLPPLLDDRDIDKSYGTADTLSENYVRLSKVLRKFKEIWEKDYISSLRERHYGAQKATNRQVINIGDIVLVQADGFRDYWPLGRILKLYHGSDWAVRSVEVLVKGKKCT